MKVFLFLLFTFFLDITFNLYININLLYPMFTLSSLIILYFLIKNKNNYNKEILEEALEIGLNIIEK